MTDYERLRDDNHVFSDLLAISGGRHQVMGESLVPEVVHSMYVGGNFFDVLGLQPAIGKLISSPNDRVGSADAAVAVISWSYWQAALISIRRLWAGPCWSTACPPRSSA